MLQLFLEGGAVPIDYLAISIIDYAGAGARTGHVFVIMGKPHAFEASRIRPALKLRR